MTRDRNKAGNGRPNRNFFRSGELHLVILAVVGEAPRHGYEVMTQLQQLFGDAYRPSPGSVYPALSVLQDEGLVVAEENGDRRVFGLSASGRDALEARRDLLASIEARTGVRLGPDGAEALVGQFSRQIRDAVKEIGLEPVRVVLAEAQTRIEAQVQQRKRST